MPCLGYMITTIKDPAAKFTFDQGAVAVQIQIPNYDYKNESLSLSCYDIYSGQLWLKYHKIRVDLRSIYAEWRYIRPSSK
jgi:hypothetical protein